MKNDNEIDAVGTYERQNGKSADKNKKIDVAFDLEDAQFKDRNNRDKAAKKNSGEIEEANFRERKLSRKDEEEFADFS